MFIRRKLPSCASSGSIIHMSVLSLLVCLFVLSACGESSPPSHPLTTGDTTSTNDGSPTATGNPQSQILPITVDDTATNLSTYPGGSMDLKISTSPYAQCSFVVTYGQTTPSKAAGIIPQPANASGVVTWHWRVDTGAHTGTWPLTISAILPSGFRTTLQVNVTVTLAPISVVNSQTNLSAPLNGTMNLSIATVPEVSG